MSAEVFAIHQGKRQFVGKKSFTLLMKSRAPHLARRNFGMEKLWCFVRVSAARNTEKELLNLDPMFDPARDIPKFNELIFQLKH